MRFYDWDELEILTYWQNRGKVFSWSQWYNLTGQQPTETNLQNLQKKIDPFWTYTQSGKNYQEKQDKLILEQYCNPDFFQIQQDNYGLGNRLSKIENGAIWHGHLQNNIWFWRQVELSKYTSLLYAIIGVKKVYLLGSCALEIANHKSDIDLAFECSRGSVLIARFWSKIVFKILKLDTYPFSVSLQYFWLGIQKRYWKFSQQKTNYLYEKTLTLEKIAQEYRHRSGIKLDGGLFFEDWKQVENYYENSPRCLSILNQHLIIQNANQREYLKSQAIGALYYEDTELTKQILIFILKLFLLFLTIPLLPIILLQLSWHWLKFSTNPNYTINFNFCAFYPKYAYSHLNYMSKIY